MSDKIIDKIRKMLDLANNAAATEGERENALRMAHALLIKHNLDMKDLHSHETKENRTTEQAETFKMKWCREVAGAIAYLFMCKMYWRDINGTKCVYSFVGKESNATTAALMTEYVISSILKEARKMYKQNLCPQSRAFGYGASYKLWDRVYSMVKTTSTSTGTGLVVLEMYDQEKAANEAFIKASGTKLVKVRDVKTDITDYQAFNKGSQYGDKIDLNLQVGDSTPAPLQLEVK